VLAVVRIGRMVGKRVESRSRAAVESVLYAHSSGQFTIAAVKIEGDLPSESD